MNQKGQKRSSKDEGLRLYDISAEGPGIMLKELPIKWKVVVLSSCYSGGHIVHLEDEYTLVITASASDKTSFGCSDRNNFTYFGEAFFKDALPESVSFVDAFEKAKSIIAEREETDEYERSLPQISGPEPILSQLKKWRESAKL